VLELLATGLSNKEIARQLGISPATVKAHIAQISALLKAHNRTEAVANAHLAGLI
jgi:DNA-binding NarL/FixJ family response regulator